MFKVVNGVYFPECEKHLTEFKEFVEKGTYQRNKLEAALSYVENFNAAIDVGAHIGLWSMELVNRFKDVIAFEPIKEHQDLFYKNVKKENYTLYPYAVGNQATFVTLEYDEANTGHTHIGKGSKRAVMVRLDDLKINEVDFIKIDVEGYEIDVVKGAEKLINTHKPVICVEQKPQNYVKDRMGAVKLLQEWSYEVRQEINRDYILTYNG